MREILTSGEFRKGPGPVLNKETTGVLRSPPIFSDKLKVIVRGWWEGKKGKYNFSYHFYTTFVLNGSN